METPRWRKEVLLLMVHILHDLIYQHLGNSGGVLFVR